METIYEIVQIKQVVQESQLKEWTIRSPEDAAGIAYNYIGEDDREVLLVICVNTKNKVTAVHRAHVGSLNASLVTSREVYKAAILNNAASVFMAHQHPSGDPVPSQEDINITRRIAESGKILGIELLDSLVIGEKKVSSLDYTSLKEKGYL